MRLPRGPAPLSKLSSLAKQEELGERGNWTAAALNENTKDRCQVALEEYPENSCPNCFLVSLTTNHMLCLVKH